MSTATRGGGGQTRPPDGPQGSLQNLGQGVGGSGQWRGQEGRVGGSQREGGGRGMERNRVGQKRVLPQSIRKDIIRRKHIPNSLSLGFEEFWELPSSMELGRWLVQQSLAPSSGYGVKRIGRCEDHRFYLQLEDEITVDRFLAAFGEEGKDWKESNGTTRKIKAKKEGDDWVLVNISNIDPDTPAEQVTGYFEHIGETKDFKQDTVDGMEMDSATIKVKNKENTTIPAYLAVKGLPGNSEGVVLWELDYPDKPMVCYRCYEQGHRRKFCRSPRVPISALLARPALTEGQGGVRGSYAQVVKSAEALRLEEKMVQDEAAKKEVEEAKQAEELIRRERRKKELVDEETRRKEDKIEEARLVKLRKEAEERRKQLNDGFSNLDEENRNIEVSYEVLSKRQVELEEKKAGLSRYKEDITDLAEDPYRKTAKKQKKAGVAADKEKLDWAAQVEVSSNVSSN